MRTRTKRVFIIVCYFFLFQSIGLISQDSLSLVDLYNSTNGIHWKHSWDLSQPMKTWWGIKVDNKKVISINLSANRLKGDLPDLNLEFLEFLNLDNTAISGAIPDFTNLKKLKRLIISSRELIDTIPNFSNLPNLEIFRISGQLITGKIPNFTKLPKLKRLSISFTNISDTIPNFSHIPQLEFLSLYSNKLSGNIPNFFNLPQLLRFTCSRNSLTDTIPNFNNIPNLIDLQCSYNNLSGRIPNFSTIPNLRYIKITHNILSGNIPHFDSLPKLKVLDFGYNELTGPIPNFKNMPYLYDIRSNYNYHSGSIPDFQYIKSLQNLDFHSNLLSGELPDYSEHPNIKVFYCSKNNIQGCFPEYVCNILFSSMNNPMLPWKGDSKEYCNGMEQVESYCDDLDSLTQCDKINMDCNCSGLLNQEDSICSIALGIFPNPVLDFINVGNIDKYISFEIYNANGLYIQSGIIYSTIDVSDLLEGIYFLKLIGNTEKNRTEKFIKL